MKRWLWLLGVLVIARAYPLHAATFDALGLIDYVDSLRDTEHWPGFSPGKIPVAVFDGQRTDREAGTRTGG